MSRTNNGRLFKNKEQMLYLSIIEVVIEVLLLIHGEEMEAKIIKSQPHLLRILQLDWICPKLVHRVQDDLDTLTAVQKLKPKWYPCHLWKGREDEGKLSLPHRLTQVLFWRLFRIAIFFSYFYIPIRFKILRILYKD